MKIYINNDIGFCFGVKNCLKLIYDQLNQNKKVFLLGMVVHNEIVNDELIKNGAKYITEKEYEYYYNISEPITIITTAHGTKLSIIEKFKKNAKINLIDTTCPVVYHNYKKIINYKQNDYDIIYIGKKNHPESIALSDYIFLVENESDIEKIIVKSNKIVVINQTTMTQENISLMLKKILSKYPNVLIETSICPATQKRQEKLIEIVSQHNSNEDFHLILGDKTSNNSNKLLEIASKYSKNSFLISSLNDIKSISIPLNANIYITSGTSTPQSFIDSIVAYLNNKQK